MTVERKRSKVIIAVVSIAMILVLGMNTGQADAASKYIGKGKAKAIAIKDSGVKKSNIVWSKVELDRGKTVKYEVDFKTKTHKYEYEIKAKTGKILDKEVEKIKKAKIKPTPKPAAPTPVTYIGKDKAKEIALADAGVAAVSFIKVEFDKDDGLMIYDIEFRTETTEYDYDINAVTGAVIKKETKALRPAVKPEPTVDPQPTDPTPTVNPQPATTYIGEAKAKEIALADAGVASATFIKVELDKEDGVMVYEVDFKAETTKYDYDINAVTGAIVKKETEAIRPAVNPQPTDPTPTVNPQPATTYIGAAKAKEIALADAGVAAASFIKVEFDKDDGLMIYDIEFRTETTEYDYDINAVTGAVIKKETKALRPAVKPEPTVDPQPTEPTVDSQPTPYIGEAKAKEIALADAGVTSVSFVKIEMDRDDGMMIYEIEFRAGKMKYEYEINAKTGRILDREIERTR